MSMSGAVATIEAVVQWYLTNAYGTWEGPARLPFFADTRRVGSFAVDLDALRAREDRALFKLLVQFSFFQSRRDVDMMDRQASMRVDVARELTSTSRLRSLMVARRCELLATAADFDDGCDVRRDFRNDTATCGYRPRTACHVKRASIAIGRMHDMGKMPTSAWLHLGPEGFRGMIARICADVRDPRGRARAFARALTAIHRIGPKLASMFVSALSVDELHPGFAPLAPEIDGRELVVVDTNVRRVLQAISPSYPSSYDAQVEHLLALARAIDLRKFRCELPRYSPRLVQQALYVFRSESNRRTVADPCAASPCASCPSALCPFARSVPAQRPAS
jgi:hypothetical protein